MDYQEKTERFECISKSHLLEVYRVSLYLLNDEEGARWITRKAFLELYKNMEYIREELYLAYLVRYVKIQADERHKSKDHKGGHDGKED